jgi:cytochrome bd-type quinol oxidase subunit 2
MSIRKTSRIAIWAALAVQLGGLLFDVVWHALHPSFEAVTVREMVNHLGTVHLPIYLGALGVLATTGLALAEQRRRRRRGLALPFAFTGALVSVAGEAWHAYTHLQLSTHSGPIAALTSFVGFLVVVVALFLSGRSERRRAARDIGQRRAA